VNTITLRNKMFAQIARYTLGESAGGGTLRLNNTNPISGNISSLIGGRMAYAEGDVTVEGGGPNSSGFNDMILVVVGGNVTIKNNITNGRLGIIALKKNGVGGNVYIRNAVTDLHVNLFLDGTLFNSSGGFDEVTGAPLWTSILERTDSLSNQLYLRGSLVSRNTIAGSVDPSAGLWILGDGTTTTDYEIAREYDLNQFREFARCFDADPVTSQPIPGTNVACDQGESLSHHVENVDVLVRDSDPDEYYSPLIIEFEPPTAEMPIFTSETGIFR
jgi:hypothetical protein